MLKALHLGGTEWYTTDDEKGQERPTQFLLGVPSEANYRAISDASVPWINAKGEMRPQTAEAVHEALVRCLHGWGNFADHAGEPLKFASCLVDSANPDTRMAKILGLIPGRTREELYLRVMELGELSQEKKA